MSNKTDINISNYELFVIDYLDGNLNANELASFILFLEENPDIKNEVYDIKGISLKDENIVYTEKSKLKKNPIIAVNGINEANYEDYFIASFENDLTSAQKKKLFNFVNKNSQLVAEYELSKKIKLVPDDSIKYYNKSSLKHEKRISPFWYSSAAAILLLLSSLWFFNYQKTEIPVKEILSVNQLKSRTNHNYNLRNKQNEIVSIQRKNIAINSVDKIEHLNNEPIEIAFATKIETRNQHSSSQFVDPYDFNKKIKYQATKAVVGINIATPEITTSGKTQKKSLFASVIKNQINKISERFKSSKPVNTELNDPTYVQVLDTGIKVFNTITGSETYTSKLYNENGKLTSYQIEGNEVLLSKNTPAGSTQ